MQWSPVFECSVGPDGQKTYRVGHELVDEFLEFASVRCRPSTVRAYAHDLKVFFAFVDKEPAEVTPKDVLVLHRRPAAVTSVSATWCGSVTAARACRRPRSSDGWRRCRVSSVTWSSGGTPG